MVETVISETNWRDALGNPISGSVQITPVSEFVTSPGSGSFRISGSTVFASIVNGAFSVSLIPTDDATPAGQYYSVRTFIGGIQHVTAWLVPTTASILSIADVEVAPPPPIPLLSSGDAISLRGLSIKAALSPSDGYVLTWVAANNRFETLATGAAGAPTTATYITQTPHASLSAEQAMSTLATGIVKNTTGTGVQSVAVPGTDYQAPLGFTPLNPASNLSDVANVGTARTSLGLGDSATKNTGVIAGTVAAGDDVRLADSRSPSGAAGGDLGGTYPNPTVNFPAPGAPATATFITQTPHASLSAEQALSALASGILKSATGTGLLSIAAPGTDYQAPLGYTPLNSASNLSDLAAAGTARTNLGLGDAAVKNTGVIAGTLAAGDDVRLSDARVPSGAAGGDVGGTYPDQLTVNFPAAGAPSGATFITQTPHASLSAEQALSSLATGLLKNTTGTGVLSAAVPGTDFEAPLGFTPLDPANDLSDVADVPTARTNLGLGDAADLALNSVTTAALTVATLPASPSAGQRAFVTDSDGVSPIAIGGGSLAAPVYYDGTNWRVEGVPDPEKTVCYASVSLSAAQLLDLDNTPVQIIAAPGAGKIIVPQGNMSVVYTFVTTPYYNIGAAFEVGWGSTSVEAAGVLTSNVLLNASTVSFLDINTFRGGPDVVENVALNIKLSSSIAGGPLLTGSIANAGTTYLPGDTITLDYPQNAILTVDSVGALGVVTAVSITTPGTTNTPASNVTTTTDSVSGSGFEYNVLTVTVGDGTAVVTVPYQVISAPVGTQFNFPD